MPEGKAGDIVDVDDGVFPDWEVLRSQFPMIGDLIYLDNASTSFSPECVLATMDQFERSYRANVGRGVHRLTRIASQKYWHAHEKVAELINGEGGITVFVKNTTEAITMISRGLAWQPGRCDCNHCF
ncbi:MAG TPA: aminotransferase class V-fold PLP-dependent enzyme [Methanocorpusculum sp.]|nr:aminotransferase class V-fold PLP-dependent enzyme [Methanocorpusculum sp.]